MTTHLYSRTLILAAVATAAALAQTPNPAPAGKYMFSESGPAYTSLAQLSFGNDGTVTGLQLMRTGGNLTTYSIQGTYSQSGAATEVSWNGTSPDAVDANGNPLTVTENIELVGSLTGEFVSLRTDAGLYGSGSMIAAGGAAGKGAYLLSGKPVDPSDVSVGVVTLDGAGNVSGRELVDSFGATNILSLSGAYATRPDGFQTLTVTGSATDADGNSITTTESYVFLATRSDLRMMRTDNGPAGIIVMAQ